MFSSRAQGMSMGPSHIYSKPSAFRGHPSERLHINAPATMNVNQSMGRRFGMSQQGEKRGGSLSDPQEAALLGVDKGTCRSARQRLSLPQQCCPCTRFLQGRPPKQCYARLAPKAVLTVQCTDAVQGFPITLIYWRMPPQMQIEISFV